MKSQFFLLFLICFVATGCQNKKEKTTDIVSKQDSINVVKKEKTIESVSNPDSTKVVKKTGTDTVAVKIPFTLALGSNALQVINKSSGSTRALTFQTAFEQTTKTVEKILQSKPTIIINQECGAGPLKMANWDNGLTLIFKEKSKNSWLFVGWADNQTKKIDLHLTTMAGIGIGSTREEMESAYVITVSKTSLGFEFATKSGDLFGIFDGNDKDSKITNLWSGISCNFR